MIIFIIILFLAFIDISLTFKTVSLYCTLKPNDDKWYEQENSLSLKLIFKKFGGGFDSFIIGSVIYFFEITVLLYVSSIILNKIILFLPLEPFFSFDDVLFTIIGMFIFLILSHFSNISYLNKKLKNKWDVPI